MSKSIAIALAIIALTVALPAARGGLGGNDNPTGISGEFNGDITTACSYDPYTGNARRSITDLTVDGSVGYPLAFTRTMTSRYTAGLPCDFGPAGNWKHSFQWSIDQITTTKKGAAAFPKTYYVNYPDGRRIAFGGSAGDQKFRGPKGVRDRLDPLANFNDNTPCYVLLPDGGKIRFQTHIVITTSGTGNNTKYTAVFTFRFNAIIDPYGQTTNITYVTEQPSGNVTMTVTEPAGRTLKLHYGRIESGNLGVIGDTVLVYVEGSDGRRVDYHYHLYTTSSSRPYTSLVGVTYFNDPSYDAVYTYRDGNTDPSERPLLRTCVDPMYGGAMWRIAYTYATGSGAFHGQLQSENHLNGTNIGAAVSTLAMTNANTRTETRGDSPTNAGNPSRTFTYTGYRLRSTTDFKGVSASQNYDNNYYLNSVTDRRGNTTTYVCGAVNGNTKQVTYPSSPGDTDSTTPATVVYYLFDGDSPYFMSEKRIGLTNGNIRTNFYARDPTTHRVTGTTYPTYTFPNSTDGFPIGELFSYDPAFGLMTSHTLRDLTSVEHWEYDSRGRVKSYWDALHVTTGTPTTRYVYNDDEQPVPPVRGLLWKTTDFRGTNPGDSSHSSTYEYNARGQVIKLVHPDGTFIRSAYNPNGTLASTTDELNHTTSYAYDDYKRVVSVTTHRGGGDNNEYKTTTCYEDMPQCEPGTVPAASSYLRTDAKPTKVISPGHKVVLTTYDQNLRTLTVTAVGDSHLAAGTTTYAYDPNGNRTTITDPNGNVTTTFYDKQNRVKGVTDPFPTHRNRDGYTVNYMYNAGGNKIQERRVDDKIRRFTYNSMGTIETQSGFAPDTTANNSFPDVVIYRYDAFGNLKVMTDALHHDYAYSYDSLSRKMLARYPLGDNSTRSEAWHYDPANNLDTYTNPATQIETLIYDSRNRLTNTSWGGAAPSVATAYDAASRVQSITSSNGTVVSYHYDDANNKLWEDQTFAGFTHRVQTDPDADGNRMNLQVKTNNTTDYSNSYQYTARNGVWQISDGQHSFTYHYGDAGDLNGNIMQRSNDQLSGDATTLRYDALNRPILATQTRANGTPLESLNYEYMPRGNIRDTYNSLNNNKGDFYRYDDRDQLINVQYSADGVSGANPNPTNPARTVAYDCGAIDRNGMTVGENGSSTATTYFRNFLNQYTSVNVGGAPARPIDYDQNFNLTSYNGVSFTYNALNQLTHAVGNGHIIDFTYDGNGRCVQRIDNNAATIFTFDGWRPVAEWNSSGSLIATNMYGIGVDEPLYTFNSHGKFYYKSDALGNVRYLLYADGNNVGAVAESYTYDAFGAPTARDANGNIVPGGSALGNRFLYKGREYLAPLGVYDYRKRIYHPELGHFLQTDPIGFAGDSANLYRYCGHHPIASSDPTGEDYITDPLAASYNALFADYNAVVSSYALYGPVADVNAHANPYSTSTPGGYSGTSTLQISDGIDPADLPSMGFGDGNQPGNDIIGKAWDSLVESFKNDPVPTGAAVIAVAAVAIIGLGELAIGLEMGEGIAEGAAIAEEMAFGGEAVAAEGGATLQEGATIYRAFGGQARALGRSWTTVAPDAVSDFRAAAGLYEGNTADFVITARLNSLEGVTFRQALPGPMTPPGATQIPEVLFHNPPVPGVNIAITGGGGW
jgi:RHS repeat-associated protein